MSRASRPPATRPSRLLRRTAALSVAVLSVLLSMTPASAAPPPVSMVTPEPFQGGAIVVERTAGETTGAPDGWRMNQDIWLTNTSGDELVLTQVDITYEGGSDPADVPVDVDAFHTLTGFWTIAPDPGSGNTIPAGETQRLKVPEERVHAFPIADTVSVAITFDGFDPLVVTNPLDEYIGEGSLPSLAFPSAAKDLAPGEYWTHGTGHQLRDHHRNQFWERFGEDWGVSRWDGDSWEGKTDDPLLLGNMNWNDDYLIWGKGLYAPTHAEVFMCANGHPDDSFANEDVDGVGDYGNFVWMDVGGSRVLYAHIQNGTMPESICPADHSQVSQSPSPKPVVEPGQFLGRVGNSGNTSNSHLHIDIQRESDGQGLPLRYHNVYGASSMAFDPNVDAPPFNLVSDAAVSMEYTDPGVGILTLPLARANLIGSIVGDPEPIQAGSQIDYTVTIRNQGPDAAPDTTVTVELPSQLTYASDTGSCVEGPPETLTCALNMAALGSAGQVDEETFTITADVPADLATGYGYPIEVTAVGNVTSSVFDDVVESFSWTSNVPPVADAGGPYANIEGGTTPLDASASFDPNADAITFAWDLDDDGMFDDATGATPSLTLGDDGSFPVSVRVTDGLGATDTDSSTVVVSNVDPTAEILGTMVIDGQDVIIGNPNGPTDFDGRSSDPGSDDLTFDWAFGDGGTASETSLVNPPAADPPGSPSIQPRVDIEDDQSHTYADACLYLLELDVTDDDLGTAHDEAAVIIAGNAGEAEKDGFWHHQYKERADGKAPNPDKDLTAEELLCYLEIAKFGSTIFDEVRSPLDTLEDGHQVFHNHDDALSSEQEKLDEELLAAWLNLANGAFGYAQLVVDTDKDHVPDLSFVDAVAQAEAVRGNPASTKDELKDARKLLEDVNKYKP